MNQLSQQDQWFEIELQLDKLKEMLREVMFSQPDPEPPLGFRKQLWIDWARQQVSEAKRRGEL